MYRNAAYRVLFHMSSDHIHILQWQTTSFSRIIKHQATIYKLCNKMANYKSRYQNSRGPTKHQSNIVLALVAKMSCSRLLDRFQKRISVVQALGFPVFSIFLFSRLLIFPLNFLPQILLESRSKRTQHTSTK